MSKFNEYKGLDLAGVADEMLARWTKDDTFHKSITTREGHPTFVFYEGPPSANGMPGIHHVMARTIKDVFCRYKTQQGYLVHRKAGWDTHGLPVELEVEKMLGLDGKINSLVYIFNSYNGENGHHQLMLYKGMLKSRFTDYTPDVIGYVNAYLSKKDLCITSNTLTADRLGDNARLLVLGVYDSLEV